MKGGTVRFSALSERDRECLTKKYGQECGIDYIRPLSAREEWFFGGEAFLSPGVLTQTLYKVTGELSPARFLRALREQDRQDALLRTNYCRLEGGTMAVVFREAPALGEAAVCQDLTQLDEQALEETLARAAEAELRRPPDPESGLLVHFLIFRTDMDGYAVLVTAAQVITDLLDVRALIRAAGGLPARARKSVPLFLRNSRMEPKQREYWGRVLASPPGPLRLPGQLSEDGSRDYRQKTFRVLLPAEAFSDLIQDAKNQRTAAMAVLATAWGVLLQMENGVSDLCVCLCVPKRGGSPEEGWQPFRMMPMRLTLRPNETVEKTVAKQIQQVAVSQPYACFDGEGFGELLGRGQRPFSHFLDFCDLLREDEPYASQTGDPEGRLLSRRSADPRNLKLNVYFRVSEEGYSVSFVYDGASFGSEAGERMAKAFSLVLRRMAADRQMPFAAFRKNLEGRFRTEEELATAYREEKKDGFRRAVSSIGLLQGADGTMTRLFLKEARIAAYFAGDRLAAMDKDMLFVAEGRLVRSVSGRDGWLHTLDEVGEGAWLNDTLLSGAQEAAFSAEVLSEQARLLVIPRAALERLLEQYPALWKNIALDALSRVGKYQRIWVQS